MQVNIERRENGEVDLTITVAAEVVAKEIENVFKETAREVQIPGFRPGKAPRAIVEAKLNQDAIRDEALERLTHSNYIDALEETGLNPIDRAKIEQSEMQEDGSFVFHALVTVMPDVKLGDYRGLKAIKSIMPVKEEAIDAEINRIRKHFTTYASLPDHVIAKTDIAIIDYVMEVEGKTLEGSEVKGYPVEVGSDTLFPSLNEELIGKKPGEVVRVEGKLPKNYPDAALADKAMVYVTTVSEVKTMVIPELTDEWTQANLEVLSVEQLRKEIGQSLENVAAYQAEQSLRDNLLSQVVQAAEVDIPEILVNRFADSREAEVMEELQQDGLDLDTFLRRRNITRADWDSRLERDARTQLKSYLVVQAIEKAESIKVSEAELKAEIERLAERDKVTPTAKKRELESSGGLEDVFTRLSRGKVMQLLVDSAEIDVQELNIEEPIQTESPEHGNE
jgi:trigger factor